MAIGKFHGVISPTTPTGSRSHQHFDARAARSARSSPETRTASPAKNAKIWPARVGLADAFGERLPLLAREQPAELLLARQDLVGGLLQDLVARWMSKRDQAGNAAFFAAAIGAVGIGLRGARIAADHVVGVRRIDVLGLALALDPFAGDQIVVQLGHSRPRYRFSGLERDDRYSLVGLPGNQRIAQRPPEERRFHLEDVAGLRRKALRAAQRARADSNRRARRRAGGSPHI